MSEAIKTLCSILDNPDPEASRRLRIGSYFRNGYDLPARWDQVRRRYRRMIETGTTRLGLESARMARAPGRINLIGEHTDYNGLPVFPMAVDRDIAAVFSPREDRRVRLVNTDPLFPDRTFDIRDSIPPYPTGDWGNYCKAAVQGLLDYYRQKRTGVERLRGFDACFDGDIPVAAGMSSSSALVVLSALLFLATNQLDLYTAEKGKLQLADCLAAAERYVGTQGGGMDQAISLMGLPGHAVKIDFFPLRTRPAPLADDYVFVVADSTIKATKTAEALDKYNRRPIECRLAAAILHRVFSERYGREVPISMLGDLKEQRLAVPQAEIRPLADSALHETPYTLEEIAALLDQDVEKTAHLYCRRRDGSIFSEPAGGFKLKPRYRHVIEEAERVELSFQALSTGNIEAFGDLMNRSHESCRDLYEISCPELDRLVAAARRAGALGSRLTGAGFGGCTVSLVENSRLESFLRQVTQSYYREYLKRDDSVLGSLIFACRAAGGATVLDEP